MKHETIATFPLADKAKADELRKQLVAEGRQAWLSMNTGPELSVSVNAALPRPMAVQPQSVARERYEAAWHVKQSLRR